MDNQTPEELAAEQVATQIPKEDEVRASIILEYGFDETNDAERIDKLVKKEVENSKKLSTAIGQKIKYRTDAETLRKSVPATPPKPNNVEPVDFEKKLDEKLRERDLEELNLPDDIKKETDEWARFKGISVKLAARAPHIAAKVADYEKGQKTEEAAISRTNKSGGKKTYSMDNPPDVDMTTKEGRDEWANWKSEMAKKGN